MNHTTGTVDQNILLSEPRPPRLQFEGAHYHIYSRGNRRERIFRRDEDYTAFEDQMLEAMRWSGVLLFNWSLMPNHFHFNLETPDGHIAEFMQRVLTRFAKYFNRTHRLVGHVFQGRYGARLIDQDNYFQEIIRYVELNPYRLKNGKLAELGQWKWSSLRYYLQSDEAQWPEGCQTAFRRVLACFGTDSASARAQLAKFLADGLKEGNWEDFYQVKDNRFVGGQDFVERAKQINEEPVRTRPRTLRETVHFEELLEKVAAVSGLGAVELATQDKNRKASRWRQALTYVARRFYRIPVIEIANRLNRNESTISLMWGRHQKDIDRWSETQRLIEALERRKPQEAQEMQNANTGM